MIKSIHNTCIICINSANETSKKWLSSILTQVLLEILIVRATLHIHSMLMIGANSNSPS